MPICWSAPISEEAIMWFWYLWWSSIMLSTESPTVVALRKHAIDPKFKLPDSWWTAAKAADEYKKKAAERMAAAASCRYLTLVTVDGRPV